MKTYVLAFAFAICTFGGFAQTQTTTADIKVGDRFEIGIPETASYQHLDIPRANIIRKRGGFFNQNDVYGLEVVVTSIKEQNDGTIKATITPKNGTRFFGSHTYLSADVAAAITARELKAL